MQNKYLTLNIREFVKSGESGENLLKQIFSTFSCIKNLDVENFLKMQSIEFAKKHQSVTYLVISTESGEIAGYFTIAVKPITVNAKLFSNTIKKKIARVSEENKENGTYNLSAYLIAQLGKNFNSSILTGKELITIAIDKIKEIQYMAGGMVVFLEAEDNPRLMDFYINQNGFHRFAVRKTKSEEPHDLVQLLKVL